MKRVFFHWVGCFFALALLLSSPARADENTALQSLSGFLAQVQTARMQFEQEVLSPGTAEAPGRVKKSSGVFYLQRPGKFRFEYEEPFAQVIVADGQTLWLYDPDLEQVIKRSQQEALGQTPASLLASARDLDELKKNFELKPMPDRDDLHWLQAKPRDPDGVLREILLGFDGPTLKILQIRDGFDQTSILSFSELQINTQLEPEQFHFVVPSGVDVLQQ